MLTAILALTVYQVECEQKLVLASESEYEVAVAYPLTSYQTAPAPALGNCTATVAEFRLSETGDVALTHLAGESVLGFLASPGPNGCPRGFEPLLLAKREALPLEVAGHRACLPEDYRYVPRSRLGELSRHYRIVSSGEVSDVCGTSGDRWEIPATDEGGVLGCVVAP